MTDRHAIVVTTINPPTFAMREIERGRGQLDADFVVIGDTKSPPDFQLGGARYLDIAAQVETGFRSAALAPVRHYARKNLGYLTAMKAGATILLETDDDNIPTDGFWNPRRRSVSAPVIREPGWSNVYRCFSNDEAIWPRGLPLDRIHDQAPRPGASSEFDCPIQQGLADDNPDVDAIYRLTRPLPVRFLSDRSVTLDESVWCPFNSQNTTWWRDAFPLLYLPAFCSFRMTDIWRGFVAQRLAWECGWRLMFHSPTVRQDRNVHDLMVDFADEVPGYLHNERIRRTLENLKLAGGPGALASNLVRAYDALIGLGLIGEGEAPLLRAWLEDVESLS